MIKQKKNNILILNLSLLRSGMANVLRGIIKKLKNTSFIDKLRKNIDFFSQWC